MTRPATPIVRWIEGGISREERTADPFGFTTALAARLGEAPTELEIVRPSLEDIYLALVADASADRTPEDAAAKGMGL